MISRWFSVLDFRHESVRLGRDKSRYDQRSRADGEWKQCKSVRGRK